MRTGVAGVTDQAVVSLTNFVTLVLVGKLAGQAALGDYALAFTVLVALLAVQESFVLSPYTVLWAHENRVTRERVLGSLLLLSAAGGAACVAFLVVGAAIGSNWGARPEALSLLIGLAAAVPAVLAREFARRVAMAHGDMGVALRLDALAAALQIGGLAILAASGRLSAATAFVCAAVGPGTAAALWHLRTARHLRPTRGPLLRDWGTAAAFGRWLGAARLASVGNGYIVPWVLAWFVTLDDVGGYAAAFSLIAATNPLLTGLTNVLAPRAARAWDEGGTAAVGAVVHRATVGFTAAATVFAGGVVLLARELLVLLYGASYAPYAPVAAVLTVSLVASALGTPADHGLRTLGRPQDTFVASLCGMLATLVSAFALVPLAGAVGGAYGLAAGSVVAAAVRLAAFHQAAGRAAVRTRVAALERI